MDNMDLQICVLSKKAYDFLNDDGERVSGMTVFYMLPDSSDILKLSINEFNKNTNLLDDIGIIPAVYLAKTELQVKKGQMFSAIKSLDYVDKVNLFDY